MLAYALLTYADVYSGSLNASFTDFYGIERSYICLYVMLTYADVC